MRPEPWPVAKVFYTALVMLGAGGIVSCAGALAWAQSEPGGAGSARPAAAQVSLIESLYRDGEGFRAETEILRFLQDYPRHAQRPAVELVRAKLFYREGHAGQSSLILFSVIDRYRRSLPPGTLRLLVFSLIRENRLQEAGRFSEAAGLPPGALYTLREPPPDTFDADSAVSWSTWIPGSGFFTLGQPGKAFSALGLNIVFTGGAVIAYQQGNRGGALALLLVELALYSGGRSAVRDEANRLNRKLREQRLEAWLAAHGEAALLAHAFGPWRGCRGQRGCE